MVMTLVHSHNHNHALARAGGCMWWKVLLVYLVALGGLLWCVYRFGESLGSSKAPNSGSSSS